LGNLQDAEDETPMEGLPGYVGTEPSPKFHHPLLRQEGLYGKARLQSFTFQ